MKSLFLSPGGHLLFDGRATTVCGAAGGRVTLLDGTEIRYNRTELRQPMGMVAAGPALRTELPVALGADPTPVLQ